MPAHPSTRPATRAQRGIAMASALIVIAILFFAVVAVLRFTSNSASNAQSVELKQTAFDAAEAGLNDGIRSLDIAQGVMANGATGSNTLTGTGAQYTWTMVYNNLGNTTSHQITGGINVPPKTAYMTATASLTNQRAQTVGAIVARAGGVKMPGGAIDAGQNISDLSHAPVLQSATNKAADVHANGIITTGGNPGTVQGSTYAAGNTNQWTQAAHSYVSAAPVAFPTAQMVSAITTTALGLAESGTTIQGSSPTGTYTGNVYVNGSINLTSGTIQFNNGGTVYINGNVTISSKAAIVNENGSLIVVTGTVSISGQGGLQVPLGSGGQLMVLATDPNPTLCASGGGGCAMTLGGNGGSVGLIFVPNGSLQMSGNGTIIGALAAGMNIVFAGGGANGAFQYDDIAGSGSITGSNYSVVSYLEN